MDRIMALHDAPARTAARTALAGLAGLAVAMGIGRFSFTPLLPVMQQESGLSVAAGGWLASANYAGYFVGALSAMAWRASARSAIRNGLLVIALSTVAMACTERFAIWLFLRAAAGFANAWVAVHVFAWSMERLAAVGRPALGGVVFAGVGAGIMSVGLACLVLASSGLGGMEGWLLLGLVALLIAVAGWTTWGEGGETSRADTRAGATTWTAEAAALVFSFGAAGFGYIVPATFLPAMARQAIQDPMIFGWAWPVFGAAAMLSTLSVPRLAAALGMRRLWFSSQLVMAVGVALPVFHPGIATIAVSAFLTGGTFMVITMASVQEAREIAGERATNLIAAMTAAFALGQIAGPISVTWLMRTEQEFSVALAAAACVLAAGACALCMRPAETRRRFDSRRQ